MENKFNWGNAIIIGIITFLIFHLIVDLFIENNIYDDTQDYYIEQKSEYNHFIGRQFIINNEVRTIIEYIPCSETFVLDDGSRIIANPDYITLHYEYNGVDSTKMIR